MGSASECEVPAARMLSPGAAKGGANALRPSFYMALPNPQRLTKTRDIERVFKRSQKNEGEFVIMRLHKKSTLPGRATVIVSKAVAKRTVPRTILRRRINEWLRTRAHIGSYAVDCVISVKPSAAKTPRRVLYRDLTRTARGLGINL